MEIDRLGLPNEEPGDQGSQNKEALKQQGDRDYKRTFRPVRLYVTTFERDRANPTDEVKERFFKVLAMTLLRMAGDPDFAAKVNAHLLAEVQDAEKIEAAHQQFPVSHKAQ